MPIFSENAPEPVVVLLNKTLLVLLTRNPGDLFDAWVDALNNLSDLPETVWIIDSSSSDETQSKAGNSGFKLTVIDPANFNHGSTRQFAVENSKAYEFIVFMTQDAILCAPDSLQNLLAVFSDSSVAAAYGRQIPRVKAGPIEAHSRLYNYPAESSVRKYSDRLRFGLKTAFLSNSFAAYRISSLLEAGGFPSDVIFGEDMYIAARLLEHGYGIAYVAEACVYHSHAYSWRQEFQRYFDMGVFHAHEPWIRQAFGGAGKEGHKFVVSEIAYLYRKAPWRIPEGIIRTIMRYAGFRLGLSCDRIPLKIKQKMCMNKSYF